MSKTRVFVDTNVILETIRIGCWATLCDRYHIETVEKCIEETLTGNPNSPSHTKVEPSVLVNKLAARHKVSKRDIASLILSHPECQGLDDGELHLLAWLHTQQLMPNTLIVISTADKAAIRATLVLGWIESLRSLEELLQKTVTKKQIDSLRPHFKTAWLSNKKTEMKLATI